MGGGMEGKLNLAYFGLSSSPSTHEENHQSHYYHRCYNPANKSPIDWWFLLEISRYGIVAAHGNHGCGGIHIGDGVYITSPADKVVALIGLSNHTDHQPGIIGEHPLVRGGYRTASGAGDGKVILGSNPQIPFGKLDLSACGDHAAVGLKPHRVIAACGDLDDVHPAADIALPVAIISHGDHAAVGLKPHRVIAACGDLDDIHPAEDIALPVAAESHRT